MQISVSNPNVPIFLPRVCTLVLFIQTAVQADISVKTKDCGIAHAQSSLVRTWLRGTVVCMIGLYNTY